MRIIRKTALRVKNGGVQRKNRHTQTPNYWNTYQTEIQLDVKKPGKGYKHFLKKRDIKKFLEILPNREESDYRLDAIILDEGDSVCFGWYKNGVIGLCAWPENMVLNINYVTFCSLKDIFNRLDVKYCMENGRVICDFTEEQIKAFLLLHILLHEIGHHVDRMSTQSKRKCPRGENYADNYAFKYEKIIWDKYFEIFS